MPIESASTSTPAQDLSFGLHWARKKTLAWFRTEPEAHSLAIMPGASNHLLWNLGHIHVIAENINEALGHARGHDSEWWALFGTGSTPMQTPATAYPSWASIVSALTDQEHRLIAALDQASTNLLDSPNPKPAGHRPDTVRGWIIHTIRHEALHLGIMHRMAKYHQAMATGSSG